MNDQDRITQLERDNSELKEALKFFLHRYLTYDGNYSKAAAQARERAKAQLREAEMLEHLAELLK